MDKNYGGVIWTNHAIQRMYERGISQGDAWATWRSPEQSRYATNKNAWIYYRTYGDERIEVVAKQDENKKWIILSVWKRLVNLNLNPMKKDKCTSSWLTKLLEQFKFNNATKD